MKKVIILGLDGFEPSIVELMMNDGRLPRFAALREAGVYGRLQTTYPAQTPVAWSSFATGANPGMHGIFDFVRRDPETYLPDLALSRFEPAKNIFSLPRVVNARKGEPFWNHLTRAGIESTILRCPCSFPPDPVRGRMLSGVGVPDLRGGQGTSLYLPRTRGSRPKRMSRSFTSNPATNSLRTSLGLETPAAVPSRIYWPICESESTARPGN